jgi:hypothetical protein
MSPNSTRRSAAAALAGAAIVGGLVAGFSAPTALAQPAQPAGPSAEPTRPMTADQALAIVARDYDLGAGGGQLSKLIDQVLSMRAKGFRPSAASRQAIVTALDKRPNQTPLIEALQATLVDQRRQMAQKGVQAPAQAAPPVATPGSPHAPMGPSWGPGNPMQRDENPIFPMPGR